MGKMWSLVKKIHRREPSPLVYEEPLAQRRGDGPIDIPDVGADPLDAVPCAVRQEDDPVNHPRHYTDGAIEVIDFIEDKKLCYHLGNALKYICRAGKKDPAKETEDLRKAAWYINRRIQKLEEGEQ